MPDLDEAIAFYRDTLGLALVHEETNEEQGVREAMMAVGDSGSCVQLLAPLTPDSTIARFLDRSGPGLQQVAYRVDDVEATAASLAGQGSAAAVRRGAARHGRQPGQLRPPQGRRRGARRAGPAGWSGACTEMQQIRDADPGRGHDERGVRRTAAARGVPGVTVHEDETGMFEGLATRDKDPQRSLHLDDVPVPEVGPGEALVAVMASAINYNTVWTSIFEPMSTFGFLKRYGRSSPLAAKHDQPYHVVGSDLAGVVLRAGPGVHAWKPGDEVVAHCLSVELESPDGHDDTMLDPQQRIWGFETNFGGLAEIALVKANQLMPKPGHLSWEEAACPGLVNSTAYRQLVSHHGAGVKLGDTVLIWGASGGLGSYATQMALAAGAQPICVVSSPDKAELCHQMGAELVIDRTAEGYRFWKDPSSTQDQAEWKRLGAKIRELTGGRDVDIVFEHPGRETFGASVYVARRGGTIVTCASTSGFMHEYDNRYLWMNLKRIVGSHFANYREAWAANDLIARGLIHPTLSRAYPLEADRPGRRRGPRQPAPGQGRRALPGPRGGPGHPQPRAPGPPPGRDRPVP